VGLDRLQDLRHPDFTVETQRKPQRSQRNPHPAGIIGPMRFLRRFPICMIGLLLCTIMGRAQRPEDAVLAVFRQLEKAVQAGNADAFVGLWSRDAVANAEKMRPYLHARPEVHYTASRTYVQGDEAALLGQMGKDQFVKMRFVKEDGRWKIRDQVGSDRAFHPDSVYAMVPPPAGAFVRSGAVWQKVAGAFDVAEAARRGWQVRAIFDEAYLYVRIETAPMPPPGSTAETPPMGWPVMKVGVAGAGEFVLHASADIGDQATFDANGRANSHRHYVAYSERLERGNEAIFEADAGLETDPLVQVGEHYFEVRVPLRTIGVTEAQRAKIAIGDAQWPKTAVFSLDVARFRQGPVER